MPSRNLPIFLVLVLAAALAAGAWWLVRTPAGTGPGVPPAPSMPFDHGPDAGAAPSPARENLTLEAEQGPTVPTTVVFPLEIDLELVASSVTPSAEGASPLGTDATARLSGSLVGAGGRPLRGSIAFVAGANDGRVLTTGRDGRFGANDLYPGLSVVRITAPGAPGAMREVLLRKDRGTLLNVPFGRPARVEGRVLDAAGEPVEGAKVTIDGQEALTDADGAFLFPSMAGGDTFAIAEKDGYAAHWEKLVVVSGQTVERSALTFVLRKPARLTVTVAERLNVDGEALVYVLPDPLDASRTYPWYRVNPVRVYPGGTVTVEDLPPVRVTLHLFHAGAIAKPATRAVVLQEGQTEAVTLHLEPAPALSGVVTEGGRPVQGAEVFLEAPERAKAMLTVIGETNYLDLEREVLPDMPPAVQSVRTNAGGEFLLSSCESVTKVRYLHARSPDGRSTAWKLLKGGETHVDLALQPAAGEGRIVVEMDGRTQGLPVEVTVDGSPRDPRVLAAHEDLEIAGLAPGSWKLTARWHGESLVTAMPVELHDEVIVALVLPEGAIAGQDEETRLRSGRGGPSGPGKNGGGGSR